LFILRSWKEVAQRREKNIKNKQLKSYKRLALSIKEHCCFLTTGVGVIQSAPRNKEKPKTFSSNVSVKHWRY
jgi:hypothetical protein